MPLIINRRKSLGLIGLAPMLLTTRLGAAQPPIELEWNDLVPEANGAQDNNPVGIIEHGEMSTPAPQNTAANVTNEFDGKTVRIPGYVVPLDFDGTLTGEFLLVPYVGACIHVPPPPPNQLIFVIADKPYKLNGMFDAVYVTGVFGTTSISTQYAEVGYSISAGKIEPYKW